MNSLEWLVMYGFPLIIAALVVRWIRIIKNNSDEQVTQNKEIIALLKDLKIRKDMRM